MSMLLAWFVEAVVWVYTGLCWTGPVFSYVVALLLVVWYLAVCCAVGYTARKHHQRSFWRWCFLAVLVTPGLGLLFLLARSRGTQ